jgi:eukaryotic-like serine/threonine-protein kinase
VALKVFKRGINRFTQLGARFMEEARTVAALSHPNIVTVYEAGSLLAVEYIAMEYVDGVRLGCLIARGRIPVSDVLNYAEQIAEALAKAHAFGVIHRDLKPGNVIIGKDGLTKVLDLA